MSQVATKKRLKIRNEHVKVTGHFHEAGSVLKGDAEGFCDGFEVEVVLETDEPRSKITDLIQLASKMCFTEKALTGTTHMEVAVSINGEKS